MQERGEIRPTPTDAPTLDVSAEFWANAKPYKRLKKPVSLRVDEDVLDWFRAQGKGHLTKMSTVLRSFYEAHMRKL
jgi:uncharacterized protein (DUF4415 family)